MYVLDGLNGAPMTEFNPEEFGFTLKDRHLFTIIIIEYS